MKFKEKKIILEAFATITDFRTHKGKIKYNLADILFLTLIGTIKGYSTYMDLHMWMMSIKNNCLYQKILNKKVIDIPVESTLHRILINVDHNELEAIFRKIFHKYSIGTDIAVDGKWLNGSDIKGLYVNEPHKAIFNVLDKTNKIVLAHKFLDKTKKSEIPAFTELLKDYRFSKGGQLFTFDALLTQVEIMNKIEKDGNFFLAKVKDNQGNLLSSVKRSCDEGEAVNSYQSNGRNKENNKEVVRTVEVFTDNEDLDYIATTSRFKGIRAFIKVNKKVTDLITGEVVDNNQYLVSNFVSTADDYCQKILDHWRVETYHYHLDMLTREDDHIAYKNPFLMSIFRSFTVNLYQLYFNKNKDNKIKGYSKTTMARIKKMSALDDEFAMELFEI